MNVFANIAQKVSLIPAGSCSPPEDVSRYMAFACFSAMSPITGSLYICP